MDYKYIDQLLERYWAAETTLEEEEILRAFFSQTTIPAEMEPYRAFFVYQSVEKKAGVLGADFDERILSMVSEEGSALSRQAGKPVVKARTLTLGQRLMPLFRAAAIVAIILTLGQAAQVPFQQPEGQVEMAGMGQQADGVSVAMKGDSATIDTLQQSRSTLKDAFAGQSLQDGAMTIGTPVDMSVGEATKTE